MSPEPAETIAFVGIGSNLDDPRAQIRRAIAALAKIPRSALCEVSSLYSSAPVGPADQPDYLNAVVRLNTRLAPEALLDQLQAIEAAQGRERDGLRWGPRTLDLDLLLYGDQVISSPRLSVPHPEMAKRSFVLYPLAEIAPDLVLPDGTPLRSLLVPGPTPEPARCGRPEDC